MCGWLHLARFGDLAPRDRVDILIQSSLHRFQCDPNHPNQLWLCSGAYFPRARGCLKRHDDPAQSNIWRTYGRCCRHYMLIYERMAWGREKIGSQIHYHSICIKCFNWGYMFVIYHRGVETFETTGRGRGNIIEFFDKDRDT